MIIMREAKFDVNPKTATDLLEFDIRIPEGFYVHGSHSNKDKIDTTGYPIQFTRNMDVATQYAGSYGVVWMLKPKSNANTIDFSSSRTSDMNRFIGYLKKMWNNPKYSSLFDPVKENIANSEGSSSIDDVSFEDFEDDVRNNFTPSKLVNSAEAYDDDTSIALLEYATSRGWPDFIYLPKQTAVLMPGSEKNVELYNLTRISKR